jgi:hypothetical protein
MPTMIEQQLIEAARHANAEARRALSEAQAARGISEQLRAQLIDQKRSTENLVAAMSRLSIQAQVGDPNVQRVENIPGRRVPFDFVVDIPFAVASTAPQQATITIDQSGPFVAVARYATFLSGYQFRVTDQQTQAQTTFNGRSFGRYRPIHSVNDLNDGQPVSAVSLAQAFPGTGAPHIASPSNASPFRSMEMDFRIEMREQGTGWPRQNVPVASSLWVRSNGDAFQLGALDFFERNQVIYFNIQPLHAPNPAYGNISGFTGPNSDYPFVDSGWDAIEGISDPTADVDGVDPVSRLASGVLQIGFHGYRIWQPAGAGQI